MKIAEKILITQIQEDIIKNHLEYFIRTKKKIKINIFLEKNHLKNLLNQ